MQCIYRKRLNPVSPSSAVLRVRIHENAKHRQSTQQYISKLLRLPGWRRKGSGRGEAGRGTKLASPFNGDAVAADDNETNVLVNDLRERSGRNVGCSCNVE